MSVVAIGPGRFESDPTHGAREIVTRDSLAGRPGTSPLGLVICQRAYVSGEIDGRDGGAGFGPRLGGIRCAQYTAQ